MYATVHLDHISADLVRKIDLALGEAVRRVDDGKAEKETVALAFTVGRDKDGDLIVVYQRKAGQVASGSWEPSKPEQGRLGLDDEDAPRRSGIETVTFRGAGKEVVMGGDRFQQHAESIGARTDSEAEEDDTELAAA